MFSSFHLFDNLFYFLSLSSSHYQEVGDISYIGTSVVTISQARGTEHLIFVLPVADSASPQALSLFAHLPEEHWDLFHLFLEATHHPRTPRQANSYASVPWFSSSFLSSSLSPFFLLHIPLPSMLGNFPPYARPKSVVLGDLFVLPCHSSASPQCEFCPFHAS